MNEERQYWRWNGTPAGVLLRRGIARLWTGCVRRIGKRQKNVDAYNTLLLLSSRPLSQLVLCTHGRSAKESDNKHKVEQAKKYKLSELHYAMGDSNPPQAYCHVGNAYVNLYTNGVLELRLITTYI